MPDTDGPRSCKTKTSATGITLRINVGTGRDDAPEGALGSGKVAPVIKVEGVKVRPEEAAQIAAGGETGHIRRRSVLSGTWPAAMPRDARRQSSSERGRPIR